MHDSSFPNRALPTLSLLAVLCLAAPAVAQDDASTSEESSAESDSSEATSTPETKLQVGTDRPDFTDSSSTVPARHLQLEAGASYSFGSDPTVDPLGVLARFGVADFAELRLGTSAVTIPVGAGAGSPDPLPSISVGGKIAGDLNDEVAVGVIPSVTADRIQGAVLFSGGAVGTVALSGGGPVSLAANVGLHNVPTAEGRGFEGSGSVSVGASITDAFSAYAELYSIVPPIGAQQLVTDAGVLVLMTDRLQLDAYFGFDLVESRPAFVGLGAGYLF